MKDLIEKLEQAVEVSNKIEPKDWGVFIPTPDAQAIISALEELESVKAMIEKFRDDVMTLNRENVRFRELIEWLNSECPEGTEETFDLSHDFTQKLRVRIERITQP